jgi:hypothetical protein
MYLGNSRVVLSSQPTVEKSPESGWFAVCGTGAPLSGEYGLPPAEGTVLALEIVDQYLYAAGGFGSSEWKTNDIITCTGGISSIRIDGTDGSEKWNQFFEIDATANDNCIYRELCGIGGDKLLVGGEQAIQQLDQNPKIAFVDISDPLIPIVLAYDVNTDYPQLQETSSIYSMTREFSSFDIGSGPTSAIGFCIIQTLANNNGDPVSSTFIFKYDDQNPNGIISPIITNYDGGPNISGEIAAVHFSNAVGDDAIYLIAFDDKVYRYRGDSGFTLITGLNTSSVAGVGAPLRNFFIDANVSKGGGGPSQPGNVIYLGGSPGNINKINSVFSGQSENISSIPSYISTINKITYSGDEQIIAAGFSSNKPIIGVWNGTSFKNLEFPDVEAGARINCIVVDSFKNIYVGGLFTFEDANGRTASNVAKYIPPASKL